MNLSFHLFTLILSIIFKNGLGQLFAGDLCTINSSGTSGICKLLSECPSAISAIRTGGTHPQICGFTNLASIVCCTEVSTPHHNVNIGSKSKTGTTSTRRITPKYNRIVTTTPSTTTQSVIILQVGDKSKQKCMEYKKYGYKRALVVPIPGEATVPPIEECPVVNVENIVGGVDAKPKEFPHMALIGFDDYDENTISWDCGGTLISEKFVLSAAHCKYDSKGLEAKYIRLGELELDSNRDDARLQQIRIKNIIRHPDFVHSLKYHDIALYELEHEAVLNTYVRPACLNTIANRTNKLGVASGWGTTAYLGERSKKLQKVTLEMFTNAECNHSYLKNKEDLPSGIIEETQFCAGSHDEAKDTCQGDSGGPIQIIGSNCSYIIIGITSFGKACGLKFPAVYVRVSAYINWIEGIVWP